MLNSCVFFFNIKGTKVCLTLATSVLVNYMYCYHHFTCVYHRYGHYGK